MAEPIDRLAAIKAIDDMLPLLPYDPLKGDYTQGITLGLALAESRIKRLPLAQPDITDAQAIDHLQNTGWMQNHDHEMYMMGKREGFADDSDSYDSLIQPEQKTGEWIKEDRGGVEYTAVCSKCGYATFWSDAEDFRYCPYCGKKMEWSND